MGGGGVQQKVTIDDKTWEGWGSHDIAYYAPRPAERASWAGCIVFLDYLMTCTYRVRKMESTFKENSGYLGLLQLKWYYMY